MPQAGIAGRRHHVTLDEPGPNVPDGDGGWRPSWNPLDPPDWWASIEPPTARQRSMEGAAAGSLLAQATHVVTGRFHAGITTQTRITYRGRTFNALAVANVEERDITTEVLAAEVVT